MEPVKAKLAQQGHLYMHQRSLKRVLALGNGKEVEAFELDVRAPNGISARLTVKAEDLIPLPMTYFGGTVP
jgi:hypothetical protein